MTTISMTDLQARLTAAQAEFDTALAALTTARQTYENDAGKAHAEHIEREQVLRSKVTANGTAADAAHAEFRRLFAAADFEKTKAVKDALFNKNDAEAIGEVLREALHDSEVSGRDVMAKASIAAERYANSYDVAFAAYARLQAYKALQECAEPMARALALIGRTRRDGSIADLSADPIAHRRGFVWDALQNLADGLPEATEPVQVEALGTLALGAFAGRKFLSPALQHQERVLREQEQRRGTTA